MTMKTARVINLNTDLLISEEDWTLNFGIEGRDAIEADVRVWVRDVLTDALRTSGVSGWAR